MIQITVKPIPKLRKAPQPPLSYPGAAADSDRAKKPRLAEPSATDEALNPGDRVEGLGNFGKPTGKLGTVEQTNEEDAVVKWDDAGRVRLHQPWLKRVWPATRLGPSAKSEASPLSSGQLLSEPVAYSTVNRHVFTAPINIASLVAGSCTRAKTHLSEWF
jgi:hypothetical protein